jgi:hypothetical protein
MQYMDGLNGLTLIKRVPGIIFSEYLITINPKEAMLINLVTELYAPGSVLATFISPPTHLDSCQVTMSTNGKM